MAGSALDTLPADDASARLVDQLLADQWITSPAVRAAFRGVPRHLFAADGFSLDVAYTDDVIITRRGPDGRATSSISAPWLQAYMLEQAGLRPGARVLEVGSGGYNAALIADISDQAAPSPPSTSTPPSSTAPAPPWTVPATGR